MRPCSPRWDAGSLRQLKVEESYERREFRAAIVCCVFLFVHAISKEDGQRPVYDFAAPILAGRPYLFLLSICILAIARMLKKNVLFLPRTCPLCCLSIYSVRIRGLDAQCESCFAQRESPPFFWSENAHHISSTN